MLTRRDFLRAGTAAILVPAHIAAHRPAHKPVRRFGRVSFPQGVLSGDPTPDGITLLTVLGDAGGFGTVHLEVAEDPGFRRIVAARDIGTRETLGWSAKARVTGLQPHTRYWYRFESRHSHSPVGRFQTALPPDSRQPVRFAAFSCADFTHGYYNAYGAMADEDVDFVVCLGDYIYAETTHSVAAGTAVRDDLVGSPSERPGVLREAITLDDYRGKYALYRSDPALRRMHAAFPMVAVWDDHELENNYAGRPAGGGLDKRAQYSQTRRAAAYQAFFEAMPLVPRGRSRIYRALRHGKALELVMLDERQYRANQPCGDKRKPACDAWGRPRPLLGSRQLRFVGDHLTATDAAWKVVGTQSMTMPVMVSGSRFTRFDAWQGYPVEREELLSRLAWSGTRDVVFIAGDAHNFFAGDVRRQMGVGKSIGPEFVTGSITSGAMGEHKVDLGDGQVFPGDDADPHSPPALVEALRGYNPWLTHADIDHHGYLVVRATPDTFDVKTRRMDTIKRPSRVVLPPHGCRWTLERGQTSLGSTVA